MAMAIEEVFQIPVQDWKAPIRELLSNSKAEVIAGKNATQLFLDGLTSRVAENPKYLEENNEFAAKLAELGVVIDRSATHATGEKARITATLAVDKKGRPIGGVSRVRKAALYLNPTVRKVLEKSPLSTAAQVVTRLITDHRAADNHSITGSSHPGELGHNLLVAESFKGWNVIQSTQSLTN